MAEKGFKRKLTAILSADVAGYSRLMAEDETATVKTIASYREIMASLIKQHRGRVVDSPGDNLLAEFSSVVDAVQCAVAVQNEIQTRNAELPDNRRMEFRIGINLGDVIDEEDRIYGDGVNIAARLEALAAPGGICVSKTAFDQIETKLPLGYEYLGEQSVKNIPKPIGAYRVLMKPDAAGKVIGEKRFLGRISRKTAMAAIIFLVILAGGMVSWNIYLQRSKKVDPASVEKMAYPLPDKPSIAILPFVNMTGDPDQEYIVDGISENIISTFSKIPSLFVIDRNSTFSYKGKHVKASQVSEELGVRYVLEGSVLMSGDRLRISAQLIEALKGHHLWAETYDRDEKDLFIIMDKISLAIAKALSVELMPFGEEAGKTLADTRSLEAWILYVKGYHHSQRLSKEDHAKAKGFLERAIELDPNFTSARALLVQQHQIAARFGFSSSRTESIKQAKKLAIETIEIDDSLSAPHAFLGNIYLQQRKYDEAIAEYEKAISLDPNNALAYCFLGRGLFFSGQPDKAIPALKKAMRLHPYYPWLFPYVLGRVYYHSGRYEDAKDIFEKVLVMCLEGSCNPKFPNMQLAQIYSELGSDKEAHYHIQKVLEHDPSFNLEARRKQNLYKDQEMNEREIEALRKAGAPEHPPSQ